jgi:ArsR family transcriptional regulator
MVKQLEKIFKALGDRNRLRIVNMLSQKPMCVCEITYVLKLSQSTVSGHLRVLKEAELVADKKEGLWVEYHLNRGSAASARILELVNQSLREDPLAAGERESALKANRNEITCKNQS